MAATPFLRHVRAAPAVGDGSLDAFDELAADAGDFRIVAMHGECGEPAGIGEAIGVERADPFVAGGAKGDIASGG